MSFGGALPTVGAQVVIQGLAQFNTAQRQIQQGLSNMGKASTDLGRASSGGWGLAASAATAGSAAIVAATVAVTTAVVGLGAEFQKALRPAIVWGGATSDQAKILSRSVLELSRDYNIAATDIAHASGDLARAGVDFTKQIQQGALEATQAMAAISSGELDAGRAAELVAQATYSYRDSQLSAVDAANLMIGAVQSSTGNWQDLYLSFKQIIPLAAALKIPFADISTTLAIMWQEGIRGETAGTSVRNALLKMINPTKEVIQVMTRYKLSLFDVNGQFMGMEPFIRQLNEQFGKQAVESGKVTDAQATMALGSLGLSRSMLALLVLAKQDTTEFKNMRGEIQKTDFKELNKQLTQTLLDQLGLAINQIKAFGTTFTESFIEKLTEGAYALNQFLHRMVSLEAVKGFSNAIGDAFAQLGALKDRLLGTAAVQSIFRSLGTTFAAAIAIARNLWATLSAIWNDPGIRKYLGTVLEGFNKLLGVTTKLGEDALPQVLAIIVGVSEAIKVGVTEALKSIPWDSISAQVKGAFDKVTIFFQKDVADLFNSWYNTAVAFWNNLPVLAQKGVNNLIPFINSILEGITATVQGAYDAAVQFAVGVANSVGQAITNTFGGVIQTVSDVADAIWEVSNKAADDIWKVFQSAWRAIAEAAQPLLDLFNEAFPGAVNVLVTAAKAAIVVGLVAYKIFQQNTEQQTKNNETVTSYLAALWNKYADGFRKLWDDTGKFLADTWNGYIDSAVAFFDFLGGALKTSFTYWAEYWRGIARDAKTAVDWIVTQLTGFFDWLEQQPIIGGKVKEIRQMFREAAGNVDDFFSKVGELPGQVIDKVRATFSSVGGTVDAIVSGIGDQLSAAFGSIGINIAKIFEDAQKAVVGMLPNVGGAVKSVQDFIGKMMEAARNSIGKTKTDIDNLLRAVREASATTGRIDLVPLKPGGTGGPGAGELEPKPADPTTQKAEWQKWVKSLLKDIPMVTDEFAEFVGEITDIDPSRLDPIVAFMHQQSGLLTEIGQSLARNLLIEMQIESVNEKLAKLATERERIELSRAAAMLPFEIKELELAQEKTRLDMQALPIEQAIASIDRQMALAQRENLDLTKQRLAIQQSMLPIQNAIAEVDKQIAAANRENYEVQRKLLQIQAEEAPIQAQIEDVERRRQAVQRENFAQLREVNAIERSLLPFKEQEYQIDQQIEKLQRVNYATESRRLRTQIDMLPIQNRIEDIDKRIALAQKTNYDLVAKEAEANLRILPLRQQMEKLDEQISDARKDDLALEERRLRTQRDMVSGQSHLRDIERNISEAQRTNYVMQQQQAQLDLEALDARLSIRDLEREISDIVDKRQQLTMRRSELIAQHEVDLKQRELDRVTKDLDELWAQFNFRSSAGLGGLAGALVPGIVDLERQKSELESLLKGLTQNLDNVHDQQEDINYQNELDTIALQLEQQAQEAILKPIQNRIDLLERQQIIERTRNAAELAGLEAERQAILDQLQPYQDVLDSIEEQSRVQELNTSITVNGLERQRAELQRMIKPYQDVIDAINTTKQVTQAQQDLAIAGLQRERELLLGQLQPYEDILEKMTRQTELADLYNQVAINGLEIQRQRLEDLQAPILAHQHSIEALQEAQRLQSEAADINYREQLQALNDQLVPLENKRIALEREIATQERNRDITLTFLNQQKQRLDDVLVPLQNQIDAIDRATAAEQVQRDITLNYLDIQKRKLEDLLFPIDTARIHIQNETDTLNLQKTAVQQLYDLQLLKLQQLELPLQQYKNILEASKQTEQDRFNFLISKFQEAINNSGLFTSKEEQEIPKRLNLWGSEVSRMTELRDRYNDVISRIGTAGNAFGPVPGQAQPTIDKFNQLRDTIGASGTPNTLVFNLNGLIGVIGNTGTGTVAAVNSLNTPMTNLGTAAGTASSKAGDLKTALNDIVGTTIGTSLGNLRLKFTGDVNSLDSAMENARAASQNLRDWLWGQPWSLAAYLNNLGENVAGVNSVRYRLAGNNDSLAHAMDETKDRSIILRDALWGQSTSLSQYLNNLNGNVDFTADRFYNGDPAGDHLYRAFYMSIKAGDDFRQAMYGQTWSVSKALIDLSDVITGRQGYIAGTSYSIARSADLAKESFNNWKDAINNAAQALRNFPTGTVNVTKTFAEGGVVPGMYNQATLAVVHGGERIIPVSAGVGPYQPTSARTASTINNMVITNNYNYNMSASYSRFQDPITVDQNMRTLVALSKR